MVTPLPKASSARFRCFFHYLYMPKTHKYPHNRAFRHVHANRAATSRRFDMCINPAPNLGRRFMIVSVLEKLKFWRACYFRSCSTKKPRVFFVL